MNIIPSILAAKLYNLEKEIKLKKLIKVHFDVMDGHFVPEISFGSFLARDLADAFPTLNLDVHLMVTNTRDQINIFNKLPNVSRVIIHFECNRHHLRLFDEIKAAGKKPGLAINPETTIESVYELLDYVESVCLMSVVPGYAGQAFLPASEEKIKKLSEVRQKKELNFSIIVDGGITYELIKKLQNLGVNEFVMGSKFFNE